MNFQNNIFCVYRVPVFIPPIDQKIVYRVLIMNETLCDDNIVSLRLNYILVTRLLHRDTFIYSKVFFCDSVTHVTRHFYSLGKQTAPFSRLLLIKDNSSIKSFVVYS